MLVEGVVQSIVKAESIRIINPPSRRRNVKAWTMMHFNVADSVAKV
ncbi:hypothetical protein JCM19239_4882 [Vibrio variabilis]|uniref:Uncharacterized protein n=1 Tax=Vibrio variabilis TaxID=990271 RepID=A0ABQ0JI64_9VIBR|nr:hypothetical protein JCM19239_4882 [Vibrio variabilis]